VQCAIEFGVAGAGPTSSGPTTAAADEVINDLDDLYFFVQFP
jgi:hypothetical protein